MPGFLFETLPYGESGFIAANQMHAKTLKMAFGSEEAMLALPFDIRAAKSPVLLFLLQFGRA